MGVLQQVVAGLPNNFPAAILVAVHVPPDRISRLPEVLARSGTLPAWHAQAGMSIEPGHIYVAPPNRHLFIEDGHLHLSSGPRENGSRPAIDVLFRSVAEVAGARAIGVLLSGLLDDGTQGLAAIKQHGGITIVQDPQEAEFASMPLSAVEHVVIDYVLTAAQLAPKLIELVKGLRPDDEHAVNLPEPDQESTTVALDKAMLETHGRWGQPSMFTCPDCGGTLWEFDEEAVLRYRCHLEHAYSAAAMAALQDEQVRRALWSAVRILEERASLWRRLARRNLERGQESAAAESQKLAQTVAQQANLIQQMILDNETLNTVE